MFVCHFKTIQQCNFALLDLSQMVRSQVCRITEHQPISLCSTISHFITLYYPGLFPAIPILLPHINLSITVRGYNFIPLFKSLCPTSFLSHLSHCPTCYISSSHLYFTITIFPCPTFHNSLSHLFPMVHFALSNLS